MESKTVYKRVTADQVIPERDLVITILPGGAVPMARISDPQTIEPTMPMPVMQALNVVSDDLALEPYYLEIVVVDEGNRWQEAWGTLIDHPTRMLPPDAGSI